MTVASTGQAPPFSTRAFDPPRDQCHRDRRQQQVDQRVLELRQHMSPSRYLRHRTQFIRPVLREPARSFLRAQTGLDIHTHTQCRRHGIGIHDRRVADLTEPVGLRGLARVALATAAAVMRALPRYVGQSARRRARQNHSWQRKASWITGLPVAGAPKLRGSAFMVATHRSNAHDQHAHNPADDHRLAEPVMPAAHRRQ